MTLRHTGKQARRCDADRPSRAAPVALVLFAGISACSGPTDVGSSAPVVGSTNAVGAAPGAALPAPAQAVPATVGPDAVEPAAPPPSSDGAATSPQPADPTGALPTPSAVPVGTEPAENPTAESRPNPPALPPSPAVPGETQSMVDPRPAAPAGPDPLAPMEPAAPMVDPNPPAPEEPEPMEPNPPAPMEPEPMVEPNPPAPEEPEPMLPPTEPMIDPNLPPPVQTDAPTIERTYKRASNRDLKLTFHLPERFNEALQHPAAILFFGGGWNSRGFQGLQFEPHAEYLASRGIIGIVADYRVRGDGAGDTPSDAVADAKSAMRYLREHQQELRIDPEAIIAGGGSAGGHLAAATDLIEAHNDPNDNLMTSARPQAVLLFNAVIDNGQGGYGFDRVEPYWESFSPLHNIRAGAAPTIAFLGTNDALIPVETGEQYCDRLQAVGTRCELHLYPGGEHGFFNNVIDDTLHKADVFLESLGYLEGSPTVSP